jgi:hypothetical protein
VHASTHPSSGDQKVLGTRLPKKSELRDRVFSAGRILTSVVSAFALWEMPSDRPAQVQQSVITSGDDENSGASGEQAARDRTELRNYWVVDLAVWSPDGGHGGKRVHDPGVVYLRDALVTILQVGFES